MLCRVRRLGTGVLLSLLGGCGGAVVTTEDVVVAPGQTAQFVMCLDREYMKASIPGATVSVYANGRPIGRTVTDADGVARVSAHLEGAPTRYEARAIVDNERVQKVGRIFKWDPSRTAVAIDVDDTISKTDYGQLFLTDVDTVSPALDHSAQAVQAMQNNYQIVYTSARPRWLHEKTRLWLEHNGFPPGPILHASKFEACLHQTAYKRDILAAFKRKHPNLLIGVGDKKVDEIACGDNGMLTVILGKSPNAYKPHCVVLKDWREVNRFFAEHRDRLADSASLASTIQASGMNLRPLFTLPPPASFAEAKPRRDRNSEVTAAPPARQPPPPKMEARSAPRPTAQNHQFITSN